MPGKGYNLVTFSGGGAGGSPGTRFEQLSMNSHVEYRRNHMVSNGGILISDDALGVLVEHNIVSASDLGIRVDNSTRAVFVRGNQVP
jgi:nitrous oxidase accessory protein NosD